MRENEMNNSRKRRLEIAKENIKKTSVAENDNDPLGDFAFLRSTVPDNRRTRFFKKLGLIKEEK